MNNEYAFASVGYGLSTEGRTLTETVEDVVNGVDFILKLYPNVSNVLVGGHSAGAHLAMNGKFLVFDLCEKFRTFETRIPMKTQNINRKSILVEAYISSCCTSSKSTNQRSPLVFRLLFFGRTNWHRNRNRYQVNL